MYARIKSVGSEEKGWQALSRRRRSSTELKKALMNISCKRVDSLPYSLTYSHPASQLRSRGLRQRMPCLHLIFTIHTLPIGRVHSWLSRRDPLERKSPLIRVQAIPRREVHASLAALLNFRPFTMGTQIWYENSWPSSRGSTQRRVYAAAAPDPPAEEFRNTPPETGVGGASYRGPAPVLNLVPVRCSKVGSSSGSSPCLGLY